MWNWGSRLLTTLVVPAVGLFAYPLLLSLYFFSLLRSALFFHIPIPPFFLNWPGEGLRGWWMLVMMDGLVALDPLAYYLCRKGLNGTLHPFIRVDLLHMGFPHTEHISGGKLNYPIDCSGGERARDFDEYCAL